MMEERCSSETPVLIRPTACHIQEDGILHSHCPENLKSYMIVHVSNSMIQDFLEKLMINEAVVFSVETLCSCMGGCTTLLTPPK
jgi:hypothetical protein